MNYKHQLKTLVKQIYPSSEYPWKERKMHRKILYKEMMDYWNTHPECSLDDMIHTYCDTDFVPTTSQEQNHQKLVRYVLILLCLVLLLGIGVFFVCHSWDAPTIRL